MKGKILIIENETILCENIAELLIIAGYDASTAYNGKEGLEKALKLKPDLIICDILMPVMDGYHVLETLAKHQLLKYTPFIFLSSKAQKDDFRKGMNLGADDYLMKPFNETELILAVESRMAKHKVKMEESCGPVISRTEIKNDQALKDFFFEKGIYFSFLKNQLVYEQDDRGEYLYLIEKGAVKIARMNQEGKELSTALKGTGDFFGFSCFGKTEMNGEFAMPLIDTTAYGLLKKDFIKLIDENQCVAEIVLELLAENINKASNSILDIAHATVRKKTSIAILEFYRILGLKTNQEFKIARKDLASVVGIATETLNRTLNDFKKEGIIDIVHRDIKVLDQKLLEEIN